MQLKREFTHNEEAGDFAPPYDAKTSDDPEEFNAVGSHVQQPNLPFHLPIIDADGGAVQQEVEGSKLIIAAAPLAQPKGYQFGLMHATPKPKQPAGYGPQSL